MGKKSLKIGVVGLVLLAFVGGSWAGIVEVKQLKVSVQPLEDGRYQVLFSFQLPPLPDSVHIDYAELTYGINLTKAPEGRMVEILAADASGEAAAPNLAYNSKPVTGLLPRDKTGAVEMKLDLTQLVAMWVAGEVENHGVLVISHRREETKALVSSVVNVDPQPDARVKIFYTEVK